jgi:hypothetical protein
MFRRMPCRGVVSRWSARAPECSQSIPYMHVFPQVRGLLGPPDRTPKAGVGSSNLPRRTVFDQFRGGLSERPEGRGAALTTNGSPLSWLSTRRATRRAQCGRRWTSSTPCSRTPNVGGWSSGTPVGLLQLPKVATTDQLWLSEADVRALVEAVRATATSLPPSSCSPCTPGREQARSLAFE